MSWLLFCFIAVFVGVIYGLVSKKILIHSDDYDPVAYASIAFVTVSCYSFLLYLIFGLHWTDFKAIFRPDVFPLLLLDVICYTIAPSLYYRSLKHLPASETSILYTLTGVYTLAIGVTLGLELFYPIRFLGIISILLAVILITFKEGVWKMNKYTWFMVVGMCFYAIAALTDKIIVSRGYFSLLFFQTLNFGLPAFLLLCMNPKSIPHLKTVYSNRKTLSFIWLNGILFLVSTFSIFNAYKYGADASQVVIILSKETVIMVIFAAIFLKETKHLFLKLIAAVFATLGIYLLR